MAATSAYQAGVESTQSQISYGIEVTWGVLPSVQFQAVRYTSESLAFVKTRSRPSEINSKREAIAAVTTQQSVSGAINGALSYGTWDDFLSVLLGNDWTATQTIAGIAGDITLTNASSTTATLSSSLTTKYQNILVGQWIRTLGFTNAANNDFWRVTAKADNSHLTLTKATTAAAPVTETPSGTAAQVRGSSLSNGTQFKSLYLQQQYSSALFFVYPGAYVASATISGGVGQFLTVAFNMLAQQEASGTGNASTGAVLAAPTGRVNDPVGGWFGVLFNEAPLAAVVDKFSLTFTNTGAAMEFGMGTPNAQGVVQGTLDVSGSLSMYFKDFTYYAKFIAESSGTLEFITRDAAGNAYVITLLNANLMDAKVDAGGPNQAVMATFTIEGNPQTAGGTVQFDRLPAT